MFPEGVLTTNPNENPMTGWSVLRLWHVMLVMAVVQQIPKAGMTAYPGTAMTSVTVCMETVADDRIQGSDLAEEISHLDGSERSVESLVPALGTGAFDGLLKGVGGKDTEDDRLSRLQGNLGHTL